MHKLIDLGLVSVETKAVQDFYRDSDGSGCFGGPNNDLYVKTDSASPYVGSPQLY
jgi:hypothetical protein